MSNEAKHEENSLIMQGGKQTITVRWRSLPWHWSPYWVGAYLVSDDITRTSPIKFQFVVNSVRGEHKFDMLNMREDIVFYLFKAIGDKAQLVGKSNVVSLERKNQPTQAHLAYTSNPGELLLSWTTGRNFTNQMVQFGPSTSNITAISMASSALLYSSEEMCGGWASGVGFRDPGIRHRAMMKATQGSKDLCYRYGSDVGDISYAKGFESEWENFMDQVWKIEEIATQVPYMTAIGNHERDWPNSGEKEKRHGKSRSVRGSFDSGGECGVAYNRRFVMPAPSPTLPSFSAFSSSASSDSPWYSFSHPLLHVAVISTEHSLEQQKKWLEEDLRLVDRSVTPWVMVVGHRPMYFTGILPGAADDQQVAQELREAFEPLLMLYKVDVVLAGHHHSYQRTCPIYHGECQKTGDGGYAAPVYLVTGNGGYLNSPIVMPKPKEFEYADSLHHGYLRVSVDEKFLEVQYLRTSRHGQAKTHDKIRLAAHN
ncbi:hypothetical protein GUITHDRAFT_161772 [Guillardia theta CCMP2712]|uniref:Purple acid phosphatase n=1 Tax=Guillardia theta (strain CCMP2712) TaxID=905079 RepID=L1JR24_GUITC|nr:hypothetical protein GUITHDRAFT_161772 [Guillardia theta CCMP2712]EKX51016.1 hypothetical protein GUITHDRAFT_161772 [Guillardia theta CCMP2712]|eukprot:XP_005837996.1 hypothetical protein GUITHDRAFT_161772 [Guillardia theta CCMP2712]